MIQHKQLPTRNLFQYQTMLVDTDPTSFIFLISQFPEIFTAGKNSFFIKGTPILDPGTDLLVEILDVNGNAVFHTPIKNYEESLSRIISVEVYQTTPVGPGSITILGQLRQQPNGSDIPDQWKDKYNIKWTRPLFIDNRIVNTSPIKVYNTPRMNVSERLIPYRQVNQIETIVTGSGTLTGSVIEEPVNLNSYVQPVYLIRNGENIFTKQMENATVELLTYSGHSFTSSIKRVWNSSIAELSSSYAENGKYVPFLSDQYTIRYSGEISYTPTTYTRSYAEIDVFNMKTFSGDIEKIKVFMKSTDFPGDYEMVSDNIIAPTKMLTTSSLATGEPILDYGYVRNQDVLDNYWASGHMTSEQY